MKYNNIITANFIERQNRFIAYVDIEGEKTRVHVKNTGRCRELLTDRATVYLTKSDNPDRSTAYDLVAAEKAGRLINMDSGAPNKVVGEWLAAGGLYQDVGLIRPETVYGNSRFDFYVESENGEKAFIEVKGVTLEHGNIASFPDAPSERALKHVYELIEAHEQGYEAYLIFVVQMDDISRVEPNWDTQPAFGEALRRARSAGVHLLACDCRVSPDEMSVGSRVPVVVDALDLIAEPLLTWYDSCRRILPWREDPTPYHVWLSEIMLQQTRVEAVKPYYERFLRELPDIASLAEADDERLLKLWEGLGYYNRVRNLKSAARTVMSKYGGRMPADYNELLTLSGVGSYTAGAVASIAFGIPVPAVDGNVLRVLARLRADDRNIHDARVKKDVEDELRGIIPGDRPGDFNQALMELGALVCIPNGEPKCGCCPWRGLCEAEKNGTAALYPGKNSRKPRITEKKTILLIQYGHLVALQKRPDTGMLAGMYEFPSLEGHQSQDKVIAYLRRFGVSPLRICRLQPSRHVFTHKEWDMTGYLVRVDDLAGMGEFVFVEPDKMTDEYPVPSAYAAYRKLL